MKTLMKTLRRHFIAAPVFIGATLALAGVAPASAGPGAEAQPVEPSAPVTDRGAAVQRAKAELNDWRVKLDAYGAKTKAESQAARTEAAEDLNKAWTKTKDAAAKLETASAAEWESAKAEFDKESSALTASWAKIGR